MRTLIIGNSASAVGAIESMRQHDQTAEILLITAEPSLIYSRPLLSHYLSGEIDEARLAYRHADFYTQHGVNAVLNSEVVAIEPQAHRVRTALGETYAYDKLLICTGGMPIVPPVPGIDTPGVFTFTRLADVRGILEYMQSRPVRDVVVVGGGMIGIKATDALVACGLHVTMVELAPRILSASFDEIASNMVANIFRQGGVDVYTENTVTKVLSEQGHVASVELKDGRVLPCDLLILGIGVRPNVRIAQEAGIQVNRGIVVDEYMRTSEPDIYAAGDVAEAYDLVVDMNRTVAIWPNAYRQGAIGGAHIVGVARADRGGVAMNTIEALGVPAMTIGNANATEKEGYEVLSELNERELTYRRLVVKDNLLVGVILVRNINRAGIYTGLIRNKIPLGDTRKSLLHERLSLLSLPDNYRKHVVTGMGIEV
ncbi:MAG: NAD(P)/FAD-dependent oxidoreductase [Chloroflexi bacterium]|nr:NAD(P)/FAD-dependent oxidoreductase [Chloroflexota bacterium]